MQQPAADPSILNIAAQGPAEAARAALNSLFRSGHPPSPPLDGAFAGALNHVEIAPVLTEIVRAITGAWLPWKGKTFHSAAGRGENIFTRDSLPLTRLYWPLYRGVRPDGPGTYRAFAFRTYLAPGLFDPDRTVLKIDYDLEGNPGPSIRRVLDEIVEVAPSIFLGKAHLKWWWGRWQTVAFFSLARG